MEVSKKKLFPAWIYDIFTQIMPFDRFLAHWLLLFILSAFLNEVFPAQLTLI
jgi:hypothetical protein